MNMAFILNNIGSANKNLGDYNLALINFQKSLDIS